jgi:hypothetical protein
MYWKRDVYDRSASMAEREEKQESLPNEKKEKLVGPTNSGEQQEEIEMHHENHQQIQDNQANASSQLLHPLSQDLLSEILSSFIVSILGVEERLEDLTFRVYLVYHIHIYSPFSSWSFFKRYNDFIALHKQVQALLLSFHEDQHLTSFYHFEFPTRHWYWTRETVIQLRTESFLNYLQRGLKIPLLASLMSQFIGFDEHTQASVENQETENTSQLTVSEQTTVVTVGPIHEIPVTDSSSSSSLLLEPLSSPLSPSSIKMNFLPTIQLQNISELLNTFTGSLLFSSLPLIAQTQRYQLGYATYRDGWNMKTLYQRIQLASPLILLIRLLSHQPQCLIGAYISCPLGPPSYEFKGDSDCFVFKLCDENIEKYSARVCDPEIVQFLKKNTSLLGDTTLTVQTEETQHTAFDKSPPRTSARTSSLLVNPPKMVKEEIFHGEEHRFPSHGGGGPDNGSGNEDKESPAPRTRTRTRTSSGFNSTLYEFVYSTTEVIVLGGSEQLGTNAIRLSNDLSSFSSGPSDTYGNPCLVTSPSHCAGPDHAIEIMTVADIEIFTAVGVFR